jgi:hypothetical protein
MAESTVIMTTEKAERAADERRLIHEARKDPKAFGEFYKLYVNQVFRYLYSRVGNVHEAGHLRGIPPAGDPARRTAGPVYSINQDKNRTKTSRNSNPILIYIWHYLSIQTSGCPPHSGVWL